VLDSR